MRIASCGSILLELIRSSSVSARARPMLRIQVSDRFLLPVTWAHALTMCLCKARRGRLPLLPSCAKWSPAPAESWKWRYYPRRDVAMRSECVRAPRSDVAVEVSVESRSESEVVVSLIYYLELKVEVAERAAHSVGKRDVMQLQLQATIAFHFTCFHLIQRLQRWEDSTMAQEALARLLRSLDFVCDVSTSKCGRRGEANKMDHRYALPRRRRSLQRRRFPRIHLTLRLGFSRHRAMYRIIGSRSSMVSHIP